MMNSDVTNPCEAALNAWLQAAYNKAFGGEAVVRALPAKDAAFGDFQCNEAMGLAKALKLPPRQVAEALLKALPLPPMVEKAEIAGPGFINITLSNAWLADQCAAFGAEAGLGIPQPGKGKTVIIDYSSPNVAKPMHIGHIRSTVIGNAIDRLLRALGYTVIADNHLGDWGTQFGILIMGYRHFLTDAERAALTVTLLEKVYVQSYNRTKEDEAWLQACRDELVKLQRGDAENRAVWEKFIAISREEFDKIYKRLDVAFDLYRGESHYQPILEETVQALIDRGIATQSEGAWIVDMKDEGLQVAIVRKSDGGFNYAATDIATVRSRVDEFDPARIIYVTDERQQLHFKQFFAICEKLGCASRAALEHVWFGLMRLPEATFSTRQGNVIKLETLLDEAEARALAIVEAAHPDWPDADRRALAAEIGIGAIKYADLSHDPQGMIVFTWEKALALDGNSGPYLQYAHARICSLLDKYRAQFPDAGEPAAYPILMTDPLERQLALFMLQFPGAVARAGEQCRPNVLADYLYNLCQHYSRFYQALPVLKAEEAVRGSRLHLCAITADILTRGLGLLGIAAPKRI